MKKIYFIFFCILQISCNETLQEDSYNVQETISFDLEKQIHDEDDFSKCFSISKVVYLDSSQNLIGSIGKVLFDKTRIYILDNNTNCLHIYSHLGKFLSKIKSVGQGPTDFSKIADFVIFHNEIVILDSQTSKLLFYNFSGKFIKKISLDFPVKNITTDGSVFFLYDGNISDKNISVMSKEGEIINKYIKTSDFLKNKSILSRKPFSKEKGGILFHNILNRDIYKITKDSVSIAYRLDFGKNTLGSSFLEENEDNNIGQLLSKASKERKVFAIDYLNNTNQFLNFSFLYKGKTYMAFYNKEKNIKKIYSLSDFSIPLRKMCSPIFNTEGEMFVTVIDSSTLADYSKQQQSIENLNDDDPILLFYELNF